MGDTRQHAHELVDRLPASQLTAIVGLLEAMLDPVAYAIANAPIDDEPVGTEERRAVAESAEWFQKNPQGIPFEEVLSDFGLTLDEVRNHKEPA